VRQALTIERGYGQLSAEIDPASIEPAIIAARRSRGSVIPPQNGLGPPPVRRHVAWRRSGRGCRRS